jgi:alpha-L-fucosidase
MSKKSYEFKLHYSVVFDVMKVKFKVQIQLCNEHHFISILDKNLSQYVDFMKKNYPPGFTYQDFASDFTAEFYNPDEWAEIFQSSGARYGILLPNCKQQ